MTQHTKLQYAESNLRASKFAVGQTWFRTPLVIKGRENTTHRCITIESLNGQTVTYSFKTYGTEKGIKTNTHINYLYSWVRLNQAQLEILKDKPICDQQESNGAYEVGDKWARVNTFGRTPHTFVSWEITKLFDKNMLEYEATRKNGSKHKCVASQMVFQTRMYNYSAKFVHQKKEVKVETTLTGWKEFETPPKSLLILPTNLPAKIGEFFSTQTYVNSMCIRNIEQLAIVICEHLDIITETVFSSILRKLSTPRISTLPEIYAVHNAIMALINSDKLANKLTGRQTKVWNIQHESPNFTVAIVAETLGTALYKFVSKFGDTIVLGVESITPENRELLL